MTKVRSSNKNISKYLVDLPLWEEDECIWSSIIQRWLHILFIWRNDAIFLLPL